MKKKIALILALLAGIAGGIWGLQATKQITLQWDVMPITEVWTAVRIYDIAGATEILLGTAACVPGPPVTCPTTMTLTVQKRAYSIVARSVNADWESVNSNVVALNGPPTPPGNLKK